MAILYTLLKPGKRSRLLLHSYQLIVLLYYLGKALKYIVAKRLSYMALKYKSFSLFHFGATPRRLAIDAAAILTHNIEKAFFHEKISRTLTFDIKGVFDRVSDRQLVQRLWE